MKETATLGGGCYWCLDAIYSRIKGVSDLRSGYSGGHKKRPTADDVYAGDTGHAEVIQFQFDTKVITYEKLLQIFFVMHDPTTLNRQGNDEGEWYRSIILFHNQPQAQTAIKVKDEFAAALWKDPIVTQIIEFEEFWPAEDYMQDFYARNPGHAYCMAVINPKIQKLRSKFASQLTG